MLQYCEVASHRIRLDSTLGAIEIGLVLSSCLFGVATCQVHSYFRKYPNDARWTKALVSVVWFCELARIIATSTSTYTYAVRDFGQPQKLWIRTPGIPITALMSGIVGPVVQSYFAYRIRRVSGKSPIAFVCWGLAILCSSGCFLSAVEGFRVKSGHQLVKEWRWLYSGTLAVSAILDITIAVSQCYFFKNERAHAMRRMAKVLDRLMLWTIQTGLLTRYVRRDLMADCDHR
ncbi:hypothetical protein PLICRDRAFT_443783 [Plicaturopsis crispa FD-325 SS-3]|uniref:DUF6534 domain-containing protein n=1 Tax=Plicaturopsis crispa FD-325 SS-3 TaxID=944288 RepID=A0A0C9T6V4_PLICR|nr:hypothetical protein PLICRDRAFT_443783 [Plicaturopsis crispa FD-325 SS-3]